MKGVEHTIITDEETVKLHTNVADFKKAYVLFSKTTDCDWSKDNGIITIQTHDIYKYAVCFCPIDNAYIKEGTYIISVVSNIYVDLSFSTTPALKRATFLTKTLNDGKRYYKVIKITKDIESQNQGLYMMLTSNKTYELKDFRYWKIEDTEGKSYKYY